jgi:hypothetical protein
MRSTFVVTNSKASDLETRKTVSFTTPISSNYCTDKMSQMHEFGKDA